MNRSSEELHRAAVARARERMRRERQEEQRAAENPDASANPSDDVR